MGPRVQGYMVAPSKPLSTLNTMFCWVFTLLLLVKHGTCNEEFTQDFHVEEEQGEVTVGTIAAGQPWASQVPSPYFIVSSQNSKVREHFHISDSDGVIRTRTRLDYEGQKQYTFVAIAQSGKNIKVNIYVEDINDHSPSFKNIEKVLPLLESAPRDAKYTLGSASDPDRDLNSTQRYEIVEGNINNAFRLETKPRQNDALLFDLAINGDLDYEEVPFYSLIIRAYDGGRPPLHGSMRLNITVIDVNDNQPIFNQSRYFAKLKENVTLGTPVLQVQATDRDSGDNGKVRYQIDRQRSDQEQHFNINPVSGVISVSKQLDYEMKNVYELIVVARDNGTQRLQTTAVVSIQIEDVNDNEPIINIIFLTEDESPTISEDAEPGDFVARISVSDPDVDTYISHVNVSLEGGDGRFGLTTRDNVVYLVILVKPLDFEIRSSYVLTVVAADSGSPPRVARKNFTINVGDINDNPPEFTRATYEVDVQEVLSVGASVVQVTARDRDGGTNSKIFYSLLPSPDAQWFSISNVTGLIRTKSRVYCDTSSELTFQVQATDFGLPRLSATARVIVRIKDANDNQPVFDQTFYNVSVPEDRALGSCILKVSASDPDCGRNGQVTYSFAQNLGFEVPLELRIDEATGDVCIQQALDYETKSSFEFPVMASDHDGLHTTAMIKVVVRDVNDNVPEFYPAQYNASLDEASSVGQEIVAVHARDADSGVFGAVTYRITSGNTQGYFAINSGTGVITVRRTLSQTQRLYTLTVEAEDGGGKRSGNRAVIRISILDGSQQPPTFSSSLYQFRIAEGRPVNSLVNRVYATNSNPGAGLIRYSIAAGNADGLFRIESGSGEITTRAVLDHEKIPYILLTVQAESSSPVSSSQAQVNITIDDINDHSPVFPVRLLEITVQENSAPNSVVYSVLATDKDSGMNGKVQYTLQDSSGMFTIDSETGQLKVVRSPDYETQSVYSMTVLGSDRGLPPQQATMQLVVNIQDVNDNSPVFAKSQYNFKITEGASVNTVIGRLNATDADSGNNGRISYTLQSGADSDMFGIAADSGNLYNKVVLDREDKEERVLTVIAVDAGLPARSSSVVVILTVLDENDNHPRFLEDAYIFQVNENLPRGTDIGVVQATDPDFTDNQRLVYSLLLPSDQFQINENTGVITTKQALDRESADKYQLTVKVSDVGFPTATAIVNIEIQVLDVNDNAPVFDQSGPYVVYVEENQPKGHVVTTITARDADEGNNAEISFHLREDSQGNYKLFNLHPRTGLLTTQEVLDHESQSQYRLQVLAMDGGQPTKTTATTVEVNVQDINEKGPEFDAPTVTFSIEENSAPGTVVGVVKARDQDSGDNGVVHYYIIGGNLFSMFGINQTTGSLYLEQSLDYEVASSYSVIVKAVDNSITNPLSNDIKVLVSVIDVNDNAPVFDTDPVVVALNENQPEGSVVYVFNAFDVDGGSAGVVHYSIVSQSPAGQWFSIGRTDGKLLTSKVIDYEETNQISLVIEARDQPNNKAESLARTVTAVIMIKDLNDNAPQFFLERTEFDILEDEPLGYPVMHVVARDDDAGKNGRITYSIESGNVGKYFSLNPETGLLAIAKNLDREAVQSVRLQIIARDHGYPQLSSETYITANIIDVNDNKPKFTQAVYNASILENQPVNTFVTAISAVDPDQGANGNIVYLIPFGMADYHFTLDEKTGRIMSNATLDREVVNQWTLTAYVKDSGYPSLYDTATVVIDVLDVNDHTPEFSEPRYRVEVAENTRMEVVHTVIATDKDSGENGKISYSIIGGNDDGKFRLDTSTGILSCQPLDREVRSSYNLTIVGRDGGNPRRSATCTVVIDVLDENDNDPVFDKPLYSKSIKESVRVSTSVLRVTATDNDIGNNAEITYSINNDAEGLFKIDNRTGVIRTASEFDREKKSSYSFQVFASDGGLYGPRSRSVQVDITIEDVNDNAPVFEQVPYRVNVSENYALGQYVLQLSAEDKDQGSNGEVMYNFAAESRYFDMDSFTGIIVTRQSLDSDAVQVHRLEVIARDKGQNPMSSTGLVEIRVGNAAGFATLSFDREEYTVNLQENAAAGTPVVTVRARHPINPTITISYTLANGNEGDMFSINRVTGQITVKDPSKLDYESIKQIRLVVSATASAAYGYTTVYINLVDMNDNPPHFTQDRYVSSVWEGSARDTYVTQIRAIDGDEGRNARITYSIIGGNVQNAFVIDPPETGIIKANIILDREIRDSYRLEIEAIDGGSPPLSTHCILKIQIIDVNDNAPFFPQYSPISVPEDAQPGREILQVTANDRDLNPILSYHLVPDNIVENKFNIDRFSGRVSITRPLDYEEMQRYNLIIMASDNQHNATTSVQLNIVDVNDNAPVFSQQSYLATVAEMTPPNSPIIQVNATDKDAGPNGAVTYSLLPMEGFYIDETSGTIFTDKTLTYSRGQPIMHLVVTAKDDGSPSQTSVTAIQLQVVDINNNAPAFTNSVFRVTVPENERKGHVLISLSATDEDDAFENKKVDYSIVTGNENGLFEVSSSTGDLMLVGGLDRESAPSYDLKVMAKDRGSPPMSSTCQVLVTVDDINDNSPVFSQNVYQTSVPEDLPEGTEVVTIIASDTDSGENGRVTYIIESGNDDNKFEIDRDSGVMKVRLPLDYETRKLHRLIIKASDSSKIHQRSAFTTVTINVTDVNEFDPDFPVFMYMETVLENEPSGAYVFTAHANDKDAGNYGKVTYELISDQPLFAVDQNTGVVTTQEMFDYESSQETYSFYIRATDLGGRSTTVPVMVTISSVDEFKPRFGKARYQFEVPGNAERGYVIGQVQAFDDDQGRSGEIRYSLSEEHEYFHIVPDTGVLVVIKDLQDTGAKREKRYAFLRRSKRALEGNNITLIIVASSWLSNSLEDRTKVELAINRTCTGCAFISQAATGDLSGTPLVLVILFVIVVIVLVVIVIIVYLRSRERKRRLPNSQYDRSFDSMSMPAALPRDIAPPTYNEIHHQNHYNRSHDHNITTSEISDQSHSASSGRGSAEEADDVDEEIRMINAAPMQSKGLRNAQDSGIQQDDDAASEHSVQNHQEYLARLGIDTSKIKALAQNNKKPPVGSSVESMHQFAEEGGGEGDGTESYPSQKVSSVKIRESSRDPDGTHEFQYTEPTNNPAASLSSVINSEEEMSGSYNWDYLLDWGPQYQPLAHVFSEIAKLKDDSIKPKKQASQLVPHKQHMNALNQNKSYPPPLLTSAPPKVLLAQPVSTRPPNSNSSSGGSNRTSQLVSLPSLPRSPISHDSSFTSPTFSPSFTPSLTPLATRSPSISPIITSKDGSTVHLNQNHRPPIASRSVIKQASSGSEQEIHI